MNPLISVIIPFYKSERFVAETLQSVLDQNYPNLEIIIVNDGSPAETLAVFEPFREKIKIISQENGGPSVARNTGIKAAQGDLIAFIDADDLWPSSHMALMVPHLAEGSEYDFVRGMVECFRINADGSREKSDPILLEMLLGAALYRRSVFDRVGPFDLMRDGEDLDWSLRLRETGCREKRIPETTLMYRRHDSNFTNMKDSIKNGQFMSIRKKLERMRANKQ